MSETTHPTDLGPFKVDGRTYVLQLEVASRNGVCSRCRGVFAGGEPIYFLKGDGPLVRNPNGFERIHPKCGVEVHDSRDPEQSSEERVSITVGNAWVETDASQIERHVVRDENGELWRFRDKRKAEGFAEGITALMKRGDMRMERLVQS